ncbi:DUF481 domain-containing protein [Cerasicoccus arenae]|nr:DUF481 domain-containing protein [Cerasicoccus arenae]MBK1858989.1 DUF481 domain-containing protein [Cerasicoccus arenae]
MLKFTLLLTSIAFCAVASADTLILKNGDRISGQLISQEDGVITFESDMIGKISVAAADATVEQPAPDFVEAAESANAIVAGAEVSSAEEAETAEDQEEVDAITRSLLDAQSWVDQWVPEGWSGKLTFGFSYLESNTETTTLNFDFNGKKDAAPHHYKFDMYYQYSNQTDKNGVDTKNLDTYGAMFGYDHDINDLMYFNSELSYLRNMVKDINHQVDLDLGIGFHVIKEDNITLNIIPAYTLQYKEAEGISQKWYNLATLKETFTYKLSEIVRFEQTASGSIAPADLDDYQYEFTAAMITKLASWIDATLAYKLTFDNTVGTSGVKKEQQIIFGFGVPY